LSAKGLTTGEIAAHLAEVYGADVSKQTISTITERYNVGSEEQTSDRATPSAAKHMDCLVRERHTESPLRCAPLPSRPRAEAIENRYPYGPSDACAHRSPM
jgi:hypothetical protein